MAGLRCQKCLGTLLVNKVHAAFEDEPAVFTQPETQALGAHERGCGHASDSGNAACTQQ